MWDLNSPNRVRTCTFCLGRWGLNHWTTWEVPFFLFLNRLKRLVRKRGLFSEPPKTWTQMDFSSQFTTEHKTWLLTISIVSDPYQSFILFPNWGSKRRVALWGAENQSELLYLLIEYVIHQLQDARLFDLPCNNNHDSRLVTSLKP